MGRGRKDLFLRITFYLAGETDIIGGALAAELRYEGGKDFPAVGMETPH